MPENNKLTDAEYFLKAGNITLKAKNYEDAEYFFKEAFKYGNIPALSGLGSLYRQTKNIT